MSEFTKVTCHMGAGGLILRIYQEVSGPFDTVSHLEKARVHLKPGVNAVSSEFMDEWLKVNSDMDLVKQKFIEIERNEDGQ